MIYLYKFKTYPIDQYIEELRKYDLVVDSYVVPKSNDIKYLSYNSNDIVDNSLFVCKGAAFKQEYLLSAVEQGASAYIAEKKYENVDANVSYIVVKDIRQAMPILAKQHYNNAAQYLYLIGITGTKGKSTTSYYVKAILDEFLLDNKRKESAIISSIDIYDGKTKQEAHLTTPEALDLHKHFYNAVESDIDFLEMEVSSQALKYNRVDGVQFDIGVFLNISEDHISPLEHPTFEDYYNSKLLLFKQTDTAIVNLDADYVEKALEAAKQSKRLITFSTKNQAADIYGYDIQKVEHDILFKVKTAKFDREFKLTMPGLFNVENSLAAIAVAFAFDINEKYMYTGIEKARSSGRMEVFASRDNSVVAIVDYAHNKLSFEKLFESTVKEYPGREIISIFGCPGVKALLRRRDLGTVAGKYAKKVYIVAEDPGYEPFEKISNEIAEYVKAQHCDYTIIEDRGEAIREAIFTAKPNSILLITGKGNETRQKYGSDYIPCVSDIEYTQRFLSEYDDLKVEK